MNTALIMAAGSGTRMQSKQKKQFLEINGKPILQYSLETFAGHDQIDYLVIVAPQRETDFVKELCGRILKSDFSVAPGGKIRQESVLNGLRACPAETEFVLIHDGVRPFIKAGLISKLLAAAAEYGAAIPVSCSRNTLKEVDNERIIRTLPRAKIYNALTPQVMNYRQILEFHTRAASLDMQFTDDSSLCEYFSYPVKAVITTDINLKITTIQDLQIARALLSEKF